MGKLLNASKIDLSNRKISEIPEFVYRCRNLKELDLSNNRITVIPKELFNMKNLKKIDLSNNKISAIYAKIAALKKLRVLNLNNNLIRTIPKQINSLIQLEKLLLGGNLLEDLEEVKNLNQLRVLNLSRNKFKTFPEQILEMSNMTHLWLNENEFQEIPVGDISRKLINLKSIYFYNPSFFNTGHGSNVLFDVKGNAKRTIDLLSYNIKDTKKQKDMISEAAKPENKKIFISYSHKDTQFKEEVEILLRSLINVVPELEFSYWSDSQIQPGSDWLEDIENSLNESSIAIMIVSTNFLASEFIMRKEVPSLLENVDEKGTLILSLIVGRCLFKKSSLRTYQALNDPNMPLNSLKPFEKDIIYEKLANAIEKHFSV